MTFEFKRANHHPTLERRMSTACSKVSGAVRSPAGIRMNRNG